MIEMTIISEDEVFNAVVFEFTDLPKDKHFELRDNMIASILKISYLKWLNDLEILEYRFDVGFQDLISFAKFEIDFDQYYSRVLSKSPNAKLTDKLIIEDKIKALKKTNPSLLQLCNGHYLIIALLTNIQNTLEKFEILMKKLWLVLVG